MAEALFTYTAVGGEGEFSVLAWDPLPVFTGAFHIDIWSSTPTPDAIGLRWGLLRESTDPDLTCWADEWYATPSGPDVERDYVVGDTPGLPWSCFDWETFVWVIRGPTNPMTAGITWYLKITYGSPCGVYDSLGLYDYADFESGTYSEMEVLCPPSVAVKMPALATILG